MYISELELQGFKSFADKTDVHFDSGITAIVGPNGCGKSNIVDALRWVLGEQRPTLLRSSNMTNVIFNGTKERNQLGMAEVSLTLVNNRGVLPTEYDEVTITRRLYRSGDSEYLINNTVCRLKDIMELFMDTGMGADAYSVIELSMVDEILEDKSDRRRLFEEAAGITKYKDKRKRTYRKLEETKSDLQRVDDILAEVRNKVTSLKSQATKARKAREYRSQLESLDKAIQYREYQEVKEELDPLNGRIENAENEKKQIRNKLDDLERSIKKARSELQKKERRQSEAERRVNQLESKIRDHQTELKIKREKIDNEKSVIEQHRLDIRQTEEDLEELRELHQQSSKKLDTLNKKLDEAAAELEESEEKFNEIQEKYREKKESLEKVNDQFATANQQLNELKNRRVKLESRIDNHQQEQKRLKEDLEDNKSEISHCQSEIERLDEEIEEAEGEHDKFRQKLEEAKNKREELSEKENELKDRLRDLRSQKDAVESEMKLLKDIAHSNEVFPSSVQFLLEECEGQFELLQPLSDLFSTDEKHAVALESVLGKAAHYLVVQSLEEAQKAVRLLREEEQGEATLIPLEEIETDWPVAEQSLYHEVTTDPAYEPLRRLFLGQVEVVEDIDQAGKISNGQSAVTYEGDVLTSEKFLRSGHKGENVGLRVGFDQKIDKLQSRLGEIDQKISDTREELTSAQQSRQSIDLESISESLKARENKVQQLRNEKNSHVNQIEMYRSKNKQLEKRRKTAESRKQEAEQTLDELQPEQKDLQQRIRDLNDQKNKLQQELEELEEERSIAQSRYNDAKLNHQDLKNKIQNHENEIRRAEKGIENRKERLEKRSGQTEEAQKRIAQYKERIEVLEQEIEELKEQKKEADQRLEEAKEACSKQRGEIKQLEEDKEEVENQKEVNVELIHHLNMAKNKFEMQAENLTDYVWDEYELTMDQIDERLEDGKELDEAKEEYKKLKGKLDRLGEVNPLAIQEYEEEKERLDFYEQQIEDLTEAEEQLKQTIREINEKATEQFDTTFEQIRDNFKRVFHTLFEETDQCDLVLEEKEDEDPLEARIKIIANPRGKRPTSINQLSGGEKTLTAIALLFAIYLVKPSPFCVLDEVDAPLDDANIERFVNMLKQFQDDTQFIIITHNKKTMSNAERMYGVTMPDTGVSQLVSVQLEDVAE